MKTNKLFGGEYVAPAIEVVSTVVEAGFGASFGEVGRAGADYDVNEGGDF